MNKRTLAREQSALRVRNMEKKHYRLSKQMKLRHAKTRATKLLTKLTGQPVVAGKTLQQLQKELRPLVQDTNTQLYWEETLRREGLGMSEGMADELSYIGSTNDYDIADPEDSIPAQPNRPEGTGLHAFEQRS